MKRVIIFALVFLLAFSSCKSKPDEASGIQTGNTAGNIKNGGYIVEADDWYYFTNYEDNDALYKASKDFKITEKISDGRYYELNICGDYIYYVDGAPGRLCRISVDGKRGRQITSKRVGNLMLSGGKVFYILSEDNDWGKLYSCDLNGKNEKLLANEVSEFCVDGNSLYYSNMEDEDSLWRMDIYGNGKRKIADGHIHGINADDEFVYYCDSDLNDNLFRMNKETMQAECINKESCWNINVSGDRIYYRNQSEKGSLYRITKDGSVKEKLADGNVVRINVVNDTVLFERVTENAGWDMLSVQTTTL